MPNVGESDDDDDGPDDIVIIVAHTSEFRAYTILFIIR
jgi:hypothetical protein